MPCIPSVLSPSLTFTSCPSPLSYTPPQHPPTDLALGRNCSLFLWSPFATGPLCTCRAGVCITAGLTTPTTSGGECLQFWQHGWPLHCTTYTTLWLHNNLQWVYTYAVGHIVYCAPVMYSLNQLKWSWVSMWSCSSYIRSCPGCTYSTYIPLYVATQQLLYGQWDVQMDETLCC